MTDTGTPTFRDILVDYFNTNPMDASAAMGEGAYALWGFIPWKSTEYKPSNFELFAAKNDIDKPTDVEDFGGEDMGSTYYKIIKFTRGDNVVFIKFQGWYASYDGAEYEDFHVVSPTTKTVVVYE